MKTIGFLLPGLGISGGIHIALRWASVLGRHGHLVYVLVPEGHDHAPIPFLRPDQVHFTVLTWEQAKRLPFDALLATWWETLPLLADFETEAYAFFAQALESQFYPQGARAQEEYSRLVVSGINVISIAHWLSDHFVRFLGVPAERVQTVLNPLDKSLWRPVTPLLPPSGRLRALVEGPHIDARKNIRETLALLEEAGIEHIWVGAVTDPGLVGRHCIQMLQGVPYRDMPAVYSSADVLVKLSNGEGMFGPPMEMFAAGGTAVAWDVPGCEEYMAHLHNCLLAPMNDFHSVLEQLRLLQERPALLTQLKACARATVAAWPDWEQQEASILAAIEQLGPAGDLGFLREVARYWRARVG